MATRYSSGSRRSGKSGCGSFLLVVLFLCAAGYAVRGVYLWYDARADYEEATRINTPGSYRGFVTKHPESGKCADAAKAGIELANRGKYLDQWVELIDALGENHCRGAVDELKATLRFPVAEVRAAGARALLRLTSSSQGLVRVTLSDPQSILSRAVTDPDPVVRANLRCVAYATGHGGSLDSVHEKSQYVLEKDKSCKQGLYGAEKL